MWEGLQWSWQVRQELLRRGLFETDMRFYGKMAAWRGSEWKIKRAVEALLALFALPVSFHRPHSLHGERLVAGCTSASAHMMGAAAAWNQGVQLGILSVLGTEGGCCTCEWAGDGG